MKKIMIASAAAALMSVSGAAYAQQMVVASSDLNVRSGPGTNYRVVGAIGANDSASVLRCSGSWCQVSYAGGEGWVSSRFLSEGEARMSGGRTNAGVASGAATGAIGGALIGGPIGAVVGGLAGATVGAGADVAAEERGGRGTGTATGVTTGAIGGALIGGPVGAVVGGIAGGAIGAGADSARGGVYVDDTVVGSTIPDTISPDLIPNRAQNNPPEFTTMNYGGRTIQVETATGKVVRVLR